jgi:hypothetical protein
MSKCLLICIRVRLNILLYLFWLSVKYPLSLKGTTKKVSKGYALSPIKCVLGIKLSGFRISFWYSGQLRHTLASFTEPGQPT